jgi:tetratricopeptide (TPR) repeat protein
VSFLHQAVDEADKAGHLASQAWRLAWLSEASLLSGQADDAAMWADQALEQARLRGERGHETWALRAQPEVASARTPTAAVKRYHEALAVAGNLGVRPLEARCHLGLAALHRAAGRRDQARAALGRARGPLRSMGMEFWLARARALGLGDSNPS